MPVQHPPVSRLTRADLQLRAKQALSNAVSGRPVHTDDAGATLLELAAGMAEQVITRINRMPDQHFRAYCNWLGAAMTPPQPAWVPLTFSAVTGAPAVTVPAGTQVVVEPEPPPPGQPAPEPLIFTTLRDLPLSPAKLALIAVRDGKRNWYANLTPADPGDPIASQPFEPHRLPQLDHILYLAVGPALTARPEGAPAAPATSRRQVRLRIPSPAPAALYALNLAWEIWNAKARRWDALEHTLAPAPDSSTPPLYEVHFPHVPLLTPSTIGGRTCAWLRARMLPRAPATDVLPEAFQPPQISAPEQITVQSDCIGLVPDYASANEQQIDVSTDALPFGEQPALGACFYLTHSEFGAASAAQTDLRPGALVSLRITLRNPRAPSASAALPPVQPSPDLRIAWEYWDGAQWLGLLADTPWNGRPMPGELLCDPFPVVIPGDVVTLSGQQLPGHRIRIQERHWNDADSITLTSTGDRWQALVEQVSPGMHAYRVTAQRGDAVRAQRWILAYNPMDQPEPTPLTLTLDVDPLAPNSALPQRRLAITTSPNSPVLISNAATAAIMHATTDEHGAYTTTIDLQPGRNDVLALVFDQNRRAVGGTVVNDMLVAAPPEHVDHTWGLTRDGAVRFTLPANAQPTIVGGRKGVWVRARIADGNYGHAAVYAPLTDPHGKQLADPRTHQPLYGLTPATFRPPVIQAIRINHHAPAAPCAHVLSENAFQIVEHTATSGAFTPFRRSAEAEPTLYLGLSGLPQGRIVQPLTVFAEVDATPDKAESYVWEYAAVQGADCVWKPLPVDDGTYGFTESGAIVFSLPPDAAPHRDFQHEQELYWIRVCRQALHRPPMQRLLLNTVWGVQCRQVRDERLHPIDESGTPIYPLSCRPLIAPSEASADQAPSIQLGRGCLEVGELLTDAEREQMARQGLRCTKRTDGLPNEYWVAWQEVIDFSASTSADRHYMLDRFHGVIHFGDGTNGMEPPPGRNNIRVDSYHWGGGCAGNVAARRKLRLLTLLPYVAEVTNYCAAAGGCDGNSPVETLGAIDRAQTSMTHWLRHRDRAVTLEDFVDLAYRASPEVGRAYAMSAPNGDRRRERPGSVRVLIVPRSDTAAPPAAGASPIDALRPSRRLISRVQHYLRARCAPGIDLNVIGPDDRTWTPVAVDATLCCLPAGQTKDQVKAAIANRLAAFLHPLTGGFDGNGWPFGVCPDAVVIVRFLKSLDGVADVTDIKVTPNAVLRRRLIYSGVHTLTIAWKK